MTAAPETGTDRGLAPALADDLASAALALARRFSAGATLWCVAPGREPHAQHVAVEFVHPVVVGARALPAVALADRDLVGAARLSVRAGDVVLAVADATDPEVREITRRAPAWGATTILIGHGTRPPAGSADHVLWHDDPDPALPATGGFVLLYHLLWELTHICFEHPGLLAADGDCTDEVCVTCSDEGRVVEVTDPGTGPTALVRTPDGEQEVAVDLVGPVHRDDLLLVHAGTALRVLRAEAPR
ncbi:hypothetical protein GCM10009613_36380 [Pseudonocardia kongjuensis]|uniref:Hydrogenase assembly protein HupF n=1 Tax=Pseudonocardia kongjuensis TaxID=102227 RepID=A0ABN1XWY4_9PSEU